MSDPVRARERGPSADRRGRSRPTCHCLECAAASVNVCGDSIGDLVQNRATIGMNVSRNFRETVTSLRSLIFRDRLGASRVRSLRSPLRALDPPDALPLGLHLPERFEIRDQITALSGRTALSPVQDVTAIIASKMRTRK